MSSQVAGAAYGAAAGADLLAAAALLPISLGRRPRDGALLAVGVLAVCAAALTLSILSLHAASDVASYSFVIRWPFGMSAVASLVALAWFAALTAPRPPRRALLALTLYAAGVAVLNGSLPHGVLIDKLRGLREVGFLGQDGLVGHMAAINPWRATSDLLVGGVFAIVIVSIAKLWRAGQRLDAALFGGAMVAVFATAVYDSLADAGVVATTYLQPFSFLVIVVALSLRAGRSAVATERSLSAYREHLEELVDDRTEALARANQQLAVEVETRTAAESALHERLAELRALYRIGKLSELATDLPSAVQPALELVGRLAGAQAAATVIDAADGTTTRFTWFAKDDGSETREPAYLDRVLDAVQRRDGVDATRTDATLGARYVTVDHNGSSAVVVTPMVRGRRRWGSLYLLGVTPKPTADQLRLIELTAGELGDLVEHFRLIAELRDAAAADVRSRIARDLHDSVSQTLYSIAMMAEALTRSVERDRKVARQNAGQIRAMTLQALADMRTLLFELRPAALAAASLSNLVRQLADATTARASVPVTAAISSHADVAAEVKLAVYRIAQEALANALRHGEPRQIFVRLDVRGDGGQLEVVDDGAGFDPSTTRDDSHGIQIMRERAEAIDAELIIESAPRQGTSVQLTWPHAYDGDHRAAPEAVQMTNRPGVADRGNAVPLQGVDA